MTAFGACTNPGAREGENEDSFGAIPDRGVWFVADGLGGHGHGAVASGIVRTVLDEKAAPETLVESIRASHAAILAAVAADPALVNMGSTVVALAVAGSRGRLAWVGDSRAYLYRNRKLAQLTVDHSVRQLLLAQGELDPQIQAQYPNPDALVRALGMEVHEPSIREMALRRHDRIVLCSDGLTKEVSEADMKTILSRIPVPQDAAEALVSQSLANGGRDNVTVIVIAYEGRTDGSLSVAGRLPGTWILLAGALLAALAGGLLWLLGSR